MDEEIAGICALVDPDFSVTIMTRDEYHFDGLDKQFTGFLFKNAKISGLTRYKKCVFIDCEFSGDVPYDNDVWLDLPVTMEKCLFIRCNLVEIGYVHLHECIIDGGYTYSAMFKGCSFIHAPIMDGDSDSSDIDNQLVYLYDKNIILWSNESDYCYFYTGSHKEDFSEKMLVVLEKTKLESKVMIVQIGRTTAVDTRGYKYRLSHFGCVSIVAETADDGGHMYLLTRIANSLVRVDQPSDDDLIRFRRLAESAYI